MTRSNLFLLATLVLYAGSCREKDAAALAPVTQSGQKSDDGRIFGRDAVITVLKDRTFISWGGKLQGMDNDESVRFRENGTVQLEVHSIGPLDFEGTFEVDDATGVISTHFRHHAEGPNTRGLPKMVVVENDGKILLFREDGKTHWHVPSDSGEEGEPALDGFWPFAEGMAK